MRVKLAKLWELLHASYWFVPTVLVAVGAGLAFGLVALDRWRGSDGSRITLGWIFEGGHEGARDVLGVIASSALGVAGVAFSITLVAFSLAASQFGPRVLRSLMRDRGNHVSLGVLLMTFVYALLVQRTIRGGDDVFVPDTAVTFGVLLAVGSVVVFIYFIHHAAESIQVPDLLARVGHDLLVGLEHLLGDRVGRRVPDPADEGDPVDATLPPDFEGDHLRLCSGVCGYVEELDLRRLMGLATRHDLVIRVVRRPGHFVFQGEPMLEVWPAERAAPVLEALRPLVAVGRYRTQEQDPMFALHQLTQVALRALSPSLNDPLTAMTALDWIGAGLARLAEGPAPAPWRYDDQGRLRLVADMPSFEEFVERALSPIRVSARDVPLVVVHLVHVVGRAAEHARDPRQRAVLQRHLAAIERDAHHADLDPRDRAAIAEAVQRTTRALEALAPQGAPSRPSPR